MPAGEDPRWGGDMPLRLFRDRTDAGRRLAQLVLERLQGREAGSEPPVVLALPRGGVPVAYEIAAALRAPLDVFLVRKLGAPGHRELGIGAIASGGVCVIDEALVQALGITRAEIDAVVAEETRELRRREERFRDGRPLPDLNGRTVILVDDGLATGSTALAGVQALRRYQPSRIVLAVPVCSEEGAALLGTVADEVVCAATPCDFRAVGYWYLRFDQTSDEEVVDLLARARRRSEGERPGVDDAG